MKRVGIDIGSLGESKGDGTDAPFIRPTCPGARIYVTRSDLTTLVQGGELFQDDQTFVPRDGYGHARARCGRPVEGWKGCAGHVVYPGLCPSCSGLEADNREMLRARKTSARGTREAAE